MRPPYPCGLFLFPGGMMGAKTVSRYDSIDPGSWMTRTFTRTPEGFLAGRAIVTSVGVFTYKNADGSTTRELRLPEEVFRRESLETMKLKPVVNDHPTELVTDENIEKYQVGSLGSNPSSTNQEVDWGGRLTEFEKMTDGFHVAIDMIINKGDAIEDVLNGKRSLSMGYECETEVASAGSVWCGMAYDCIQRNIRYNHVAIVDAARAGDAARIRMDSGSAVLINHQDASGSSPRPKSNQEDKKMKKLKLDSGVECEGTDDLVDAYVKTKDRADAAEKALAAAKTDAEDKVKALSTLEAERDTLKDRADKAEKELADAKAQNLDQAKIDAAVDAKVILLDAANRANVEVKKDMKDIDIKKAVIMSVFPNAKLDGQNEVYIAARFDAAVEDLDARTDGENREVGGSLPAADSGTRSDSAAAYQRMVDGYKSRSRGDKKGE
jgi:hypothetical protein